MIALIKNILFPQTYRTPAELPHDDWKSYRHSMLINVSTSKASAGYPAQTS